MTGLFAGVAVLAVGTYLTRLAGPMLRSRIRIGDRAQRIMDRSAVVLLVAVAVTGTIYVSSEFTGWARPAGVGVGIVAALCKAPLVAVIVLAAATTAGLRAAGVG